MGPIEVRVIPEPLDLIRRTVRQNALQKTDGVISVADDREDTGDILLRDNVVRIDGQSPRRPLACALDFSKMYPGKRTTMGRTRIFRVAIKCMFGPPHTDASPTFGVRRAAPASERPSSGEWVTNSRRA
jgi:hypothetical protein